MHAAVYVLTMLPDHIKKMIKWYLLSFGTKLCQIVRPLIATLPSCYNSCWRYKTTLKLTFVKVMKPFILYELLIAFLSYDIKDKAVSTIDRHDRLQDVKAIFDKSFKHYIAEMRIDELANTLLYN